MVDVRTLLVVTGTCDVLVATILWIAAGRRLRHGVAEWIASLFARACALAVLAVGNAPASSLVPAASALLALSMTLQAASLLSYESKRLPAWVHTAAIAAVAVPLALIATEATNTVLFGGLVFGTFAAALAFIAARLQPATSRATARQVLVTTFAIGAIAFYMRGVTAMLSAEPLRAFISPTPFQSMVFVAACACAIAASLGFLLLHKERAEAEAARLATMDPLTATYNRRTFHEIAERELSRARRFGQALSIIIVDIDHFRPVNEKHGNRTGDEILQRIADLVRGALRKEDMVVRYGGEEFLVMLPEVPGPGAVVVAGRIRKSVEAEPLKVGGEEIALTVSVGVSARLDEGPESIDRLLSRAEEALALAKERGRNRVVALSLGRSIAA